MDRAQIEHLAELAELSLSPEQGQRLADEIGRIVAYVKELEAVDTSGVEPTTSVVAGAGAGWRDDVVDPGLSHEDALREAPRVEHDGFSVPTFVES
jgi:aspartyl-tRNA(Asn)/glutamyl-tRNA(Gln) amidotransferase subunit C